MKYTIAFFVQVRLKKTEIRNKKYKPETLNLLVLSFITSQITVVITESSSVILYNPDMYPVNGTTSLHDSPMIF